MLHTCYHVLSDHHNKYLRTLPEVQTEINRWNKNGESHIEICEVFTVEEVGSDAIWLNEVQIPISDIKLN